MYRRPETVIMVAFATGSVTVQTNYKPAEVKAIFAELDYTTRVAKHPVDGSDMTVEEASIITLKSITETKVKEDPRSDVIQYILKNEEVSFRKKDVVFWSVSEAADAPRITEVKKGPLIVP